MAIQKNKVLTNGSSGNYWKIISESLDRISLICTYKIALFKDQEHSNNNAPHLGLEKKFSFQLTPEECLGNRTALGYNKIKDKAESLVVLPVLNLNDSPTQRIFDEDLSNGEDV